MKKLTLSMTAIAAMGTMVMAGGDIAPVEPAVETPVVAAPATDNGFYVGLGYGYMSSDIRVADAFDVYKFDSDYDALMLQAGYKINRYVAVEGRYWNTIGDGDNTFSHNNVSLGWDSDVLDMDAYGFYVKPMYPVTNELNIYGLLGYAKTDISTGSPLSDALKGELADVDGFSWGLGAAYAINNNVSLFVDYTMLYDDDTTENGWKEDDTIDSWNFGVSYKF
jgi:opacity protein-like surface antigen